MYRISVKKLQRLVCFAILVALVGCSKVSVPVIKQKVGEKKLTAAEIESITKSPPGASIKLVAENTPLPDSALPTLEAGDINTYGIKVTNGLEKAYRAFLAGDGEKALVYIDAEAKQAEDPGLKWQLSFLKVQILLMMGKGGDAEAELIETAQLETNFIGHDLNTTALRAEVKTWLGDYKGALHDLALVIHAIGNWELPISYMSFPTNREQLYMFTTAKLRAYTALTAINIFQENYQAALTWGEETERLFNNVHFVNNHPLYGAGDKPHADSFYGRAMNLTFLASASLAINKDQEKAESLFKAANSFYDALGYSVGKVTTAALKARIYNRLGMHDLCYQAGKKAMEMAVEANLPDYIWRIGILSGKTLLAKGRKRDAEIAFRQAQASVELISGGLSTDHAKTRFGVGKEDITYHLAMLDIEKEDWSTLFSDMEKGRARAFMDLLRDRPVIRNRHTKMMEEISRLENEIRRLRLRNLAFSQSNTDNKGVEPGLLNQRNKLVSRLKKIDPELAELVSVSASPLKQVQNGLADGEVIAYFIPSKQEDSLKFLRITNTSANLVKFPVSISELEQQIDDLSLAFFDPEDLENRGVILKRKMSSGQEPVSPEYAVNALKKSLAVHRWEVQKNVYVIPTGILHFIPWSILDTSFPISTLPTGDWLNRKTNGKEPKRKIAIVGDPDFGGSLPQLIGARVEAKQVGRLYGTRPLLGEEASESNLRKQVGEGVKILHFATHGIYDSIRPLRSALYLTNNGNAWPLTAMRLFENPIPASVVILSACETGLGKSVAGDDLLGLSRSFYLGGTRSILSSLWEIEDEGTREFMLKFHQEAINGQYGMAWLKARDHVKSKGFPASVYGAFNLSGFLH